jgi:hypothetical protein
MDVNPEHAGRDLLHEGQRLVGSVTSRVVAPIDGVFDMLEASAVSMRRQAEAMQAAARALEESARLMKTQAEIYERTIHSLRQPTDFVKSITETQGR